MTALMIVIEHVRHRVAWTGQWPLPHPGFTVCGRRFMGQWHADQNTRHHQPETARCDRCYP